MLHQLDPSDELAGGDAALKWVSIAPQNEGRAKLEFLIIRPQRKALRSQTIFIDPGHQSLGVASQGSDLRPAKEAD